MVEDNSLYRVEEEAGMTNAIGVEGTPLSQLTFGSKFLFGVGFLFKVTILYGIFIGLNILKQIICLNSLWKTGQLQDDSLILFAILVLGYCIIYDIFFIISEGIIGKMIFGLILTLIGSAVVFFFPPAGAIIALLGLISMIKSIVGIIKMIPMLLLGVLISFFLLADILLIYFDRSLFEEFVKNPIYVKKIYHFTIVFFVYDIPYLVCTALISLVLAFKYNLKMALFRQTVLFLAIPIIALVIWLIKSALSNSLFQPQHQQQAVIRDNRVFVHAYQRADGTCVASHFRSRPIFKK